MVKFNNIHRMMAEIVPIQKVRFVLSGFRAYLALHLEGFPVSHSCRYDSARDRPTCFASYTLIPESFTRYVGWEPVGLSMICPATALCVDYTLSGHKNRCA